MCRLQWRGYHKRDKYHYWIFSVQCPPEKIIYLSRLWFSEAFEGQNKLAHQIFKPGMFFIPPMLNISQLDWYERLISKICSTGLLCVVWLSIVHSWDFSHTLLPWYCHLEMLTCYVFFQCIMWFTHEHSVFHQYTWSIWNIMKSQNILR